MELKDNYARLTVISKEIIRIGNRRLVKVLCACGTIKEVDFYNLRKDKIKSCGCYHKEMTVNSHRTHGLTKHPIYKLWSKVKERCYNKNCKDYNNYGRRGVKMCDEWLNDFKYFYDWAIVNGWKRGLQLDKDIKGDGTIYSPSTCMFTTCLENNRHQRSTKLTQEIADEIRNTFLSKKYLQSEIANMYGIKQPTVSAIVLNILWPNSNYVPHKVIRKKRREKEGSIMNMCKKYKISYWAVMHRKKDKKISSLEALDFYLKK